MGYIHSREAIHEAAVEVAQEAGLGELTYRLVAERLNIGTRTVVYYFPTKVDLLLAVLETVATKVESAIAGALGDGPHTVEQAFLGMWRSLANEEIDPFFRLYLELFGLAVARRAPYRDVMFRLCHQWADWLAPRMAGPADEQRAAAVAALGQVDGLLLWRHVGAPEPADEAEAWIRRYGHLGARAAGQPIYSSESSPAGN